MAEHTTTEGLTYGSAFTGIGGLDVAVEHCFGATPIWHAEIDPYAAAVLRKHWPGVPNIGDVKGLSYGQTQRPDIICGGFPCQDISMAGAGRGLNGPRSGLWWDLARAIDVLRPSIVILENVSALRVRGLSEVLAELTRLGFDAAWSTCRAADVGAPHLRSRIFIVAAQSSLSHADRQRIWQLGERQREQHCEPSTPIAGAVGSLESVSNAAGLRCTGRPSKARRQAGDGAGRDSVELAHASGPRRIEPRSTAAGAPRRDKPTDDGGVADPHGSRPLGERIQGLRHRGGTTGRDNANGRDGRKLWPPPPGDTEGWARWDGPKPGVRRGSYGPPRGLDARRRRVRLRCIGNAVVPLQAEYAIQGLWQRLMEASR